MTFALTRSSEAFAIAPADVCKMPPYGSPTAVPNVALFINSTSTFPKVQIKGANVFTIADQILMSSGNEASLSFGGGVISGVAMGKAQATIGSSKVFMGGNPLVRFTDTVVHNGLDSKQANCIGVPNMPTQEKLCVLS